MKTRNRYLILLSIFTVIILIVVILIIAGQGSGEPATSSQIPQVVSTVESSTEPVSSSTEVVSEPVSSEPAPAPSSVTPDSSVAPAETQNYDSDVLAFSYPGSWVASTANDTVILIIPDSGNASVNFSVRTIESSDLVNLDTARGLVEAQFKSNYPNAEVTSEITTVGERNAAVIHVSGSISENSGELQITQYVLGFGTKYVYVMYTAEPGRYDTYLSQVEDIIANFTVK